MAILGLSSGVGVRLIAFHGEDGTSHVGVVLEGAAVADVTLGAAEEGLPRLRDVRDVLSLGSGWRVAVERLAARAARGDPGTRVAALADVTLSAPLGTRSLILCTGANFRKHRKEMARRSGSTLEPAQRPRGFMKNPAAVVGHGDAVRRPRNWPDMVDYEGEIAAVIGVPCFEAAKGSGEQYIAGYTLLNDISARDWVPTIRSAATGQETINAWESNIMFKQFPTFCPIGPAFVTSDEIEQPHELPLRTTVNGEVRQDSSLEDLEFDFNELVVYFSQHYRLRPGDIVTSGTPGGVAVGMPTPRFLQPGDTVAVESPPLGVLRNDVL